MTLVFVRHGQPDYSTDTLTEKGKKEAAAFASYWEGKKAAFVYVSPLGRARETASFYEERTGKKAVVLPFLREFSYPVENPGNPFVPWDVYPLDLERHPLLLDPVHWSEDEALRKAGIGVKAKDVFDAFDRLLEEHGYWRERNHYAVLRPNHETLLFFGHFGVDSLILSHLLNCSPYVLWQGTVALTSSFTVVTTEERQEGAASFRIQVLGATNHLEKAGLSPSFEARFAECFQDPERH